MFEDSTFESMGVIHTQSSRWMMATFALNGTILLALAVFPLLYPQALPPVIKAIWMEAPPPPLEPPKPQPAPASAVSVRPQIEESCLQAPSVIPKQIFYELHQEASTPINVADWADRDLNSSSKNLNSSIRVKVVQSQQTNTVRLPSSLVTGLLIYKVTPLYPAIARAAGQQGTVVLQATISKAGSIENLRVVSGLPMLQQAAMDAVAQWRYRPYLLNGQPVEVETTVNVVFKLD